MSFIKCLEVLNECYIHVSYIVYDNMVVAERIVD